jgi:tetratricopeptide (TPR) repeat protein
MFGVGCSIFALPLFAGEPDLLTEARRALAESIPQIAVAKLETLRANTGLNATDRAASTLLLAEALLAVGRFDDALRQVEPLVAIGTPGAPLLQAHILAAASRWQEALPIYEKLANSPGAPTETHLALVESLYATGRTGRAIEILEAFTRANPRAVTARLRLAGLLAEMRQVSRARAELAAAHPEAPGDLLWKKYIEGRLLLLEGKAGQAAAIFEEVTTAPENLSENLLVAATLAMTDARIALSGYEIADRVLEGFISKYHQSPSLEIIFRRLDRVYAAEKNPPEGELQRWATGTEKRRAALARFYVAQMQMRSRKFDRATISIDAFLKRFSTAMANSEVGDLVARLLPRIYMMQADVNLERQRFSDAVFSLEAAERLAKSEETRAEIELRTGLVHYQEGEFLLATNKFESAARRSASLRATAGYDAALATLQQKNFDRFLEQYREFSSQYPESELRAELILEEGLLQARTGDQRAEETLELFLIHFGKHPRQSEVRLALAEIAFRTGDQIAAARYLQAANRAPRQEATDEHAEYLGIFLEEAKMPRDDAKVVDLARRFIQKHLGSSLLPEVRLKLGQVYFRNEDYANAETQFATLARESPTSPYAESALFLAGQSAMKTINTGAIERALELFNQVVKRDGPLKLYARQQQAIVQSGLGKETEAIKLYDIILAAQPAPDPELRYASLCEKGNNLAILGRKDPTQLEAALAVYDELASSDAPAAWRNQALYKKASALELLGRASEALLAYYDVLGRGAAEEREYLWYYKAGFEAARMFEANKEWKSAIGVYEKMAALEGPRSVEARSQIKQLRLEHFIPWE